MPIDTSMYQVQPAPQPNLLGMMGQAASIQNAMNQNQLFQQTNRARLAVGKIMEDSIDKQTGQPDYDKAAISLSQHPDTALIAPELIKTWVGLKNLNLDNTIKSLDIARQRAGDIADVVGSTLARAHEGKSYTDKNGNGVVDALSQEDLFRAVNHSSLIAHNIPTEMKMQLLTKFGYPDDPRKPRDYDPRKGFQDAVQFGLAKAGAEKTMTGVFNNLKEVDTGGGKIIGQVNPTQSSFKPLQGGVIPQKASIEQQTRRVKTTTESGESGEAPAYAVPGALPPGSMGGGATQDATPVQTQSVRPPGATGAQPTGAGGATTEQPPGYQRTELNPYKKAALQEVATKYEPDLNRRAQSSEDLLNLITESREMLKHFDANAATGLRSRMALALKAADVSPDIVKRVAGGDVSSQVAFDKLAVQGATAAMAQLFKGSGSKFTQEEWRRFQQAYPNLSTDAGAIHKMYDFMQYVSHNTKLEQEYFNKFKSNPNYDLTQYQGWWNKTSAAIRDNYWKDRLGTKKANAVLRGGEGEQ